MRQPGLLAVQPPRLCDNAILLVTEDKSNGTPAKEGEGRRYRLRAVKRTDGNTIALCRDGDLVTDPLTAWGGAFPRADALIVLDGNRLIGYPLENRNSKPESGEK